jgi:hypothetical protein
MNILGIKTYSGSSADGFEVRIQDEEENKIFEHQYCYGYDASYSKEFAKQAHDDVKKAKKYKWTSTYEEKPYTTDILVDLVNKYNVEKILVSTGRYLFNRKSMTVGEVDEFISKYIEPNSQLSELLDKGE